MQYLDRFTDHLEFLGYKIEKLDTSPKDDFYSALATHTKNNNIALIAQKNIDLILFQIRLNFDKRVTTIMYEYLDEVNGRVDLARAYIDEESSQLILQTHWTSTYDKKLFGEFLAMFENDQKILVSLPHFDKIWV